jgi:tRNA pseudouridine55 synthase
MNSNHVVGYFKRNLPGDFGKIGHFGTLDPFASGVLMLGVAGGAKLNDYIHEYCPKTYLAVGKLGVHTETGDLTSPITLNDESLYFQSTISQFDKHFLQSQFEQKFKGEYWQAPHKYSAAKSQGRPLHEWARMGVEVVKEEKKRFIHEIEVVKFKFPYLVFRAQVSSGTYIRTLMNDLAHHLGTHGTLVSLTREKVGNVHLKNLLNRKCWPVKGLLNDKVWNYDDFSLDVDEVLNLTHLELNEVESTRYLNGQKLDWRWKLSSSNNLFWVRDSNKVILGIGTRDEDKLKVVFNFERDLTSPLIP